MQPKMCWRRCGGEEVLPRGADEDVVAEMCWRRSAAGEVVQEMLHDEGAGSFLILSGDDGRKGH